MGFRGAISRAFDGLRTALVRAPTAPSLVMALAAILVAAPLEGQPLGRRALDALLLGAPVMAVIGCRPRRRVIDVAAGLCAFGLAAGILVDIHPSWALGVTRAALGAVLSMGAAALLARQVHRATTGTLETGLAAVGAFLLLAIGWAELWGALRHLQPWALVVIPPAAAEISEWAPSTLLHHSLLVLTTLDDGVVVATTPLSRALTAIQGLTGSLSLVALVARLAALGVGSRAAGAALPSRGAGRRPPVKLTLVRGERDDEQP